LVAWDQLVLGRRLAQKFEHLQFLWGTRIETG
jgi:hypothetical protein